MVAFLLLHGRMMMKIRDDGKSIIFSVFFSEVQMMKPYGLVNFTGKQIFEKYYLKILF
jgi:hypothetical protein